MGMCRLGTTTATTRHRSLAPTSPSHRATVAISRLSTESRTWLVSGRLGNFARSLLSRIAVSPWFSTHFGNEVSYSKNWVFPGDLLWYHRWNELLTLKPRFIEIITWND